MFGLIFATVVFLSLGIFLRWLGSRENPTFVSMVAANTHALVVKKSNTAIRDKDGNIIGVNNDGGDVTDVIHAIPGKKLNKSNPDPMEWHYIRGREPRGFFFTLFGVIFIWFFRYLRISEVRQFRWGRKKGEQSYDMMSKTYIGRFPYFSGQHDILQEHIETKRIIKFNLRLNLTLEENYPVKVRLRFADPYAVLTMMVNDHVINEIGAIDPKKFIGDVDELMPDEGDQKLAKENLKKGLIDSFDRIRGAVEKETGIYIREVALPDFDFDEETRKLLEAKTKAELEGEAGIVKARLGAEQAVAAAKGARDAQILRNEGDADRVKNVILKIAEAGENAVRVREAEAYENNGVVTTYAPDKTAMIGVK